MWIWCRKEKISWTEHISNEGVLNKMWNAIGCPAWLPAVKLDLELDRYIGNTHHRDRLWDNRNHRQMMTIGDQSVPIFHDDVTH